jgi:hypothetical protein
VSGTVPNAAKKVTTLHKTYISEREIDNHIDKYNMFEISDVSSNY